MKTFNFKEGEVILINKDRDWTSFDVVKKVRGLIREKVGHAGTLDPMATGLLILCSGKMTKRIDEYQAKEKEYTGSFYLGAETPSLDLETEVTCTYDISGITEEMIAGAAKALTGTIEQMPPQYSAKKIGGRRAYKSARKGEYIKLLPQQVTVHEFEITGIELPLVHFRIVCSKGTYIRALARDFGKLLLNGAYLHDLKRTKIGTHTLDDAMDIRQFEQLVKESRVIHSEKGIN